MADNELWQATYTATCTEELNAAYRDWACDYDRDTLDGMGYVGPTVACRLLDSYVESPKASILDAGCGTGLVGQVLSDMGYSRMHAMDVSPDMLAEAESKDVYDRLFTCDMNRTLRLPDDSYDATICVGTFTYAHVGPEALKELARVTRPEGFVCFTVRDGVYQDLDFRTTMLDMETDGTWQMLSMVDEDYLRGEGVRAKFCTYKVLDGPEVQA